MSIALILTWLLGVVFTIAGLLKLLMPMGALAQQPNMGWVERVGPFSVRTAGAAELVAGLTLIGTALGISVLGETNAYAVIAAFGLATIMGLAAVRVHRPAGEPVIPNLVLGALSLILALLLL